MFVWNLFHKLMILHCTIYLNRNPNLSRTQDIEASFSPFPKGNPNLRPRLKLGVLRQSTTLSLIKIIILSHYSALYGLTPRDVSVLMSPLTFDPSIVEIFAALSCGSRLLLVPDVIKMVPGLFGDVITKHGVTVMQVSLVFT